MNFDVFIEARKDLAKEFVIKKSFNLPFQFIRIGKWWYKDKEIDLIALNEHTKQIAFFEVKWHEFEREEEAKRIIEKLKEKSAFVNWFNPTRGIFWDNCEEDRSGGERRIKR
ncbi:MAG: DUF234 domain-containing protein [Methanophagales archaeon]|nr:DUF234 domain-containing protein [Methanophagales archaeon]